MLQKMSQAQRRFIIYIGWFLILFWGFFMIRHLNWSGSKQWHTVAEVIAMMLAFMIGGFAIMRFYTQRQNLYLFIGAGFIGTGLLDCYHAIVTSSTFEMFLPSPPSTLIPWSWNASRLYLSVVMLIAWWTSEHEHTKSKTDPHYSFIVQTTSILCAFAFCIFFMFYNLPRAYYPELVFGRPEEHLSALIFLLALVGFFIRSKWQHDIFEHCIILSLITAFMCQAMFMSTSYRLFDVMFEVSHLLKIVS